MRCSPKFEAKIYTLQQFEGSESILIFFSLLYWRILPFFPIGGFFLFFPLCLPHPHPHPYLQPRPHPHPHNKSPPSPFTLNPHPSLSPSPSPSLFTLTLRPHPHPYPSPSPSPFTLIFTLHPHPSPSPSPSPLHPHPHPLWFGRWSQLPHVACPVSVLCGATSQHLGPNTHTYYTQLAQVLPHPSPFTLHSSPFTLHPTPYTQP